ncbi:MAG: CotH kinase family protein, partial [Saprospiraceae bacterium]
MIRKIGGQRLLGLIFLMQLSIPSPVASRTNDIFKKLYSVPIPPAFSKPGGLYPSPFTLTLASEANTNIYYTLDGTVPTEKSNVYIGTLSIPATTAVRAIAIRLNEVPSEVITQTYFINEPANLPLISLVTDPANLFSDQTGIYVTGKNGIRGSCDPVIRNLNQDWERPVNIELYEKNGKLAFNQGAGIKIFGGCSRTRFPQKSFSLFARKKYGNGSFNYQIFPDKPIYSFESFLLRSGADDQVRTMFRDAFTAYAIRDDMDIDYMAYRPAAVFINGQYWGIHNMREKVNEHFLASNFNVEEDEVNLLERNATEFIGDNDGYNTMLNFLNISDMSQSINYETISRLIDINQFIDYEVANIHLAEVDWPGNNIKFWNVANSQYDHWRWVLFDRDQTFMSDRITTDALALATATNGPTWPNPPWSTLILRRLLLNKDFKNRFIQTYAHHISNTFDSIRISKILDVFKQGIAAEIPRHITKWGGKVDPDKSETWPIPTFNSVSQWEKNVEVIRSFPGKREPNAIQHLKSMFALGERSELSIKTNLSNAGYVRLFDKKLLPDYKGKFFNAVPLKLYALPQPGYLFSHWIVDGSTILKEELELIPAKSTSIIAHFILNPEGELPLVINEINYHSPDAPDAGDWFEIYNPNKYKIDISGWRVYDGDDNNPMIFRPNTLIDGSGYLVICESIALFEKVHPKVYNRLGGMGFKLSNDGEVVKLYNAENVFVDSVSYKDKTPWPQPADGDGPSLELISANLDNNLPASWHASGGNGTPGKANSVYTKANDISTVYFRLFQNYPNPVQSFTWFSYTLHRKGKVILKVSDQFGREIEKVVDTDQSPG